MRSKRLSKEELAEVGQIMSIGNTALKECAAMMGFKSQRKFRGKLFGNKLDTSTLTPMELAKLEASKPLIFAVRDQCEERVRLNFKRMVAKQAWFAARNVYDRNNAREEFMQEGELAVLDGIYGYTNTKWKLSTYIFSCIRRRIFEAVNRMNPLCPLTNEAIDLVRQVQQLQGTDVDLSDEQAVEILGFTSEESEVFFRSITKVMNDMKFDREQDHADDYTANRRGVDNDFKEVFFIRKEARQAVKDANLSNFEFACLIGFIFPYHGWKEDVASKHINEKTGERFTRQNVQYTLERAKNKVREAYLHPAEVSLENFAVDKFFDEWDAEKAVKEDMQNK